MTLRDLVHNVKVESSLAPSVHTNSSVTGYSVDLRGFDSAMIMVSVGEYTDGTHTITVQHSDDGSSFTDVSADELQGAIDVINGNEFDNKTQLVGYIGSKRFVRTNIVTTGATTGALCAAYVIAGNPNQAPV